MDMEYEGKKYLRDLRKKTPINRKKSNIKTQGWTVMMVSQLEALKELYQWIIKIAEIKKKQVQVPIPQATVVTDASPQRWGATQELDYGELLVAHGAWS
ncbi:MAG: hypothetical protein EZS28_031950 [Streblomastix strix]|uniref:Uncharacterized protein n=1 Tax=Streblomastix strix TaxID=222440 RepID=A0A5J4URT8_9EUKA|nr:MAG: hypothetical protein EZS28_031950 [Streblomastix strix]